ncbi:Uncharacterized protein TCM_006113 [Theobroma cacao]|uniref:Uncharacterized protein n=1 Tax=Theobroma cacao TaxID=3641 RepID=A0A061DVZ7_THECC|nr:Uncharacterized protein TCM_006113 [Theobroma cacao]
MESWEHKNLRNELIREMKLARKLQAYLKASKEACELQKQILSSQGKALSIINCSTSSTAAKPKYIAHSPPTRKGSCQSEDSDHDFKEQYYGRHTRTIASDVMPPRLPKILAPSDTVGDGDGYDKQDSKSSLQSSVNNPVDQTCISSTEVTSELPNSELNQNEFPNPSYTSPLTILYEYQVRKNCKVLNRKKDVLLLLSCYPMIMIDKFDSKKWITDKLLDVPLTNDIERALPGDIVENLYRPTEADLRPLLEVEQNIIAGKTSKSRGSPSHSEGAAMETENELQPMPARCKTQVEDTELSTKETLCITISGRDNQNGAKVHGVFHLQKGFWLGGCSDAVGLTPEYSDHLCSLGNLLLMEDDYDENMNLDHFTLPFLITVDMEIRMEDHLFSWKLFHRIVGEVSLSPSIQQMAACMVKECRGNLLAILLMAKDIENVVNALTFVWDHMNKKTRHCIEFYILYHKGKKINRFELIQCWVKENVVGTYDEGDRILQSLIDIFLLNNFVVLNCVELQGEIYDVLVNLVIPQSQMHPLCLMKGGLRLIKPPKEELWWDAKEIHLMDNKLSDLPESPTCPSLFKLYLQKNLDLMAIPSCFFKHMPLLEILDLSHTSIKSLPESLSSLVKLREFLLKGCELFTQLPSHVGELKNLEKLDLDGTQIIDLPAEIGHLSKLKILRVPFYGYMNCSKTMLRRDTIIPHGTISGLSELTELSIEVDPDDERWNATVVSRVPEEVEAHFDKGDKCLKFVKGKDIPAEMRMALNHNTAFFLEGHATARSLSDFGIENSRQLKFCLLTECNEVQTIIDWAEFPEEQTDALGNLQDLNIYYMKNLRSIWRGTVHKNWLASLKFLALHKCPRLSTIFTPDRIANLASSEEVIVEHRPQLTSLASLIGRASCNSAPQPNCFLPSLKRISLLYVPKLISISCGLHIASKLEKVGFYNCLKLKSLSTMEMSSENLKVIKGERHWWEALEWKNSEWGNRLDYLHSIFSPLIKEREVKAQLREERIMLHAST